MPTPTHYEGQTATNPQTGEKISFQKGKWVPVQGPAQRQAAADAQYMLRQLGRAEGQSGFFNTGLMSAPGQLFTGSSTNKLEDTIAPIKANLAFGKLLEMRQNSPNGAAVGNVTDKDLELLAATAGALGVGQGEKQLDRSLRDIQQRYGDILIRLGYPAQPMAEPPPGTRAPAANAAPGAPAAPAPSNLPKLVIR